MRGYYMLKHPELLRIPGPTPIPPRVQQAMNQPMIGHRGEEAKQLLQDIRHKLKHVFGTEEEVMILTSSGTSALEAAVVNGVSENDEVLVIVAGAFGDRFANICESYRLNVHRLNVEWGQAVDPDDVKQMLIKHPSIKAVFATYCETSTSVLHPVKEISQVVHEHSDALMIVDGVSAVGGVETNMDDWGVDVFVSGSQKAFMLPAGLSFITMSERAQKIATNNQQPRFYLDVLKHRDQLQENSTPFTPGLSLLMGLQEVLTMFEEEGLDNVYRRHLLMKEMTRAALKALNIPLLVGDDHASPTVTAFMPVDVDADLLRQTLNNEFGLVLAGGQQHLKGKIIRMGHMGYCSPAHVLQMISLLEIGLKKLNKNITLGQGVAAAQDIYITSEEA